MLAMKIIGCIVLGILTALAFGYGFLYLLSKSLDWLDAHYGTRIRRLLKPRLQNGGNDGRRKRGDAEYRIYLHYLLQSARRLLKWVNDAVYIYVRPQHKNSENQYSNARPKGSVQTRHFPSCRILSHSSILNRFRKGGKTMTKFNDLVDKVGLFAIGLGIGSFLTIARTQPTSPFELRVGLVAISVAALFVGLFSLRPSEDYQANDEKNYATDKEMAIFIPDYPNKGTSYYQPHAKPFHFHMLLSLLRHIVSYGKRVCQPKWKRTLGAVGNFTGLDLPLRHNCVNQAHNPSRHQGDGQIIIDRQGKRLYNGGRDRPQRQKLRL